MKNTLQQVFSSPKFLVGFGIFMTILLTVIIYPMIIKDPPLAIIGQGTFFEPGIYVNVFDSVNSKPYILSLSDAAAKRLASKLDDQQRLDMKTWLVTAGVPENEINTQDTEKLLALVMPVCSRICAAVPTFAALPWMGS